jgi:hypothetical protein
VSENVKTTFKLLRPEDVWQPVLGAPKGNRNALKSGRHTAAARALRARVRDWRRATKALVERVGKEAADAAVAEGDLIHAEPRRRGG